MKKDLPQRIWPVSGVQPMASLNVNEAALLRDFRTLPASDQHSILAFVKLRAARAAQNSSVKGIHLKVIK